MTAVIIPVRQVTELERRGCSPLDSVRKSLPSSYHAETLPDGTIRITGEDIPGWTLEDWLGTS